LNGARAIRIEPPLIEDETQCDMALAALDDVCRVLAEGNSGQLLAHLVGRVEPVPSPVRRPEDDFEGPDGPAPDEGLFAFLVHPVDLGNHPEFDRSLEPYTEEEMARLSERFNALIEPFVVGKTHFVSDTGVKESGRA